MLLSLISVLGLACSAVSGLISLVGFAFWLWMLVDCLTSTALVGADKIVWVLVIIFLPVVGAIVYFIFAKQRRW